MFEMHKPHSHVYVIILPAQIQIHWTRGQWLITASFMYLFTVVQNIHCVTEGSISGFELACILWLCCLRRQT